MVPRLCASQTKGSRLEEALKLLPQCINREVKKFDGANKGDWRPHIIVLTNGHTTNRAELTKQAALFRSDTQVAGIVAVACGDRPDQEQLHTLADKVVQLKDMSSEILSYFTWVS